MIAEGSTVSSPNEEETRILDVRNYTSFQNTSKLVSVSQSCINKEPNYSLIKEKKFESIILLS